MAVPAFKEAIDLLTKRPGLWLPGHITGILGVALWVILNIFGTFFASRLLIIFSLIALFFLTGLIVSIKTGETSVQSMLSGGLKYYFRVLLPFLVIVFGVMVVFSIVMMVMTLAVDGMPDITLLSLLTIFIMIPILFLSSFSGIAAVFNDLQVLDSIRRSVSFTSTNAGIVIAFFLVCAAYCFAIIFGLMMVWEAFLFEHLQPLTEYNETQIASLTPDQLIGLMGPDGMWITAAVLFVGLFLIIPVVVTFMACFYRKNTGGVVQIQQQGGEFDSKGRWYKY